MLTSCRSRRSCRRCNVFNIARYSVVRLPSASLVSTPLGWSLISSSESLLRLMVIVLSSSLSLSKIEAGEGTLYSQVHM